MKINDAGGNLTSCPKCQSNVLEILSPAEDLMVLHCEYCGFDGPASETVAGALAGWNNLSRSGKEKGT